MSFDYWNYHAPTRIVFGHGVLERLGVEAQRVAAKPTAQSIAAPRALLVTDRVLERIGHVERLGRLLEASGFVPGVFADCVPEPSIDVAGQAIALGHEIRPDVIVALGGGSNIDVGKMTACVLAHGGSPRDYFGFDRVPGPVVPLIAIPTTAGTGSEVSHSTVLTDPVDAVKVSTLSRQLRPALALVDPSLLASCPPSVVRDSGLDALTHAVEAMTARPFGALPSAERDALPYTGQHPLGDLLARGAIERINRSLVPLYRDRANQAAQADMALAATLGGMAFSNSGVAVVHALEYPLGVAVHCSHGLGNGLLLPHVMEFNLPARTDALAEVGRALGVDTAHASPETIARRGIDRVRELQRSVELTTQLRDLGVVRDQLPELARKAFGIKRLMLLNGREPTEPDLLAILEAAW